MTIDSRNDQALERGQWPTIQQVAEYTQLSPQTIRRRIADGTIEARRIGPRLIRVNPRSLDNLGTPLQYLGDAA